jgi:4-aminobutyrate aminotransferase / (S)-3-amino-2-methylpropionate transaminase / 5-aminovalerate transaminase
VSDLELIRTEIPGPRSRNLASRVRAFEPRGVTHVADDFPTFWSNASGATVSDVDGNRYLDLTAAFGVATTGHANPAVAGAVSAQAARLPHGMGDVHPSDIKVALLERLAALAPVEHAKTYLCTTGSDSVEFALKTALLATGKPNAIAFRGAYHGLAHGALEVTGIERFRAPFREQLRGATTFVDYPRSGDPSGVQRAVDEIEAALARDAGIGAIVAEPIQGRAGVVVPPDGFLRALRELCDARNLLLILDEIYTGFGRTGAMFAVMHERVTPDLLCVGKALGGGFPIAATIGGARVMDAWQPSTGEALHTSTYLGNPMGCAAALANLEEIERLDVPARARSLGKRFEARLAPLRGRAHVCDVRGRGALWGIELADGGAARASVVRALRSGLILLQSGLRGEVLTIAPPVVIDDEQLERALDLLEAALPDPGPA